MEQLSVTEYAKLLGVTRQAVLWQIKEKRLSEGVTCKKIGNTYSLSVRGQKRKRKKMIKNETLIRSKAITANVSAMCSFGIKSTTLSNYK